MSREEKKEKKELDAIADEMGDRIILPCDEGWRAECGWAWRLLAAFLQRSFGIPITFVLNASEGNPGMEIVVSSKHGEYRRGCVAYFDYLLYTQVGHAREVLLRHVREAFNHD
jgi:hypothetical protein